MDKASNILATTLSNDCFGIFHLHGELPGIQGDGTARYKPFQIVWFTRDADAVTTIDFEQYPVKADSVYCISPSQVHTISGEPVDGFRILFSVDIFSTLEDDDIRWLFNPLVNDGLMVCGEIRDKLEVLSQLMIDECAGMNEPVVFNAYLQAFLRYLVRSGSGRKLSFGSAAVRLNKLFSLVNTYYKKERKVSFYASRVGLSSKRLNEILKETTGVTLTEILHYSLIIQAKREIGEGEKNLKEIAFELGFSEQAYFSRFFKKHTGQTPQEFRRQVFRLSKKSG